VSSLRSPSAPKQDSDHVHGAPSSLAHAMSGPHATAAVGTSTYSAQQPGPVEPARAPATDESSHDEEDDGSDRGGSGFPSGDKVGRKTRQNFTTTQLAVLECVFSTTPLPRKAIRAQLAEQLGLPQRSVQVWFQNRRQKWKSNYRATLMSAVCQQQQQATIAVSMTSTPSCAPATAALVPGRPMAAAPGAAPAALAAVPLRSPGASDAPSPVPLLPRPAGLAVDPARTDIASLQRRWQEQWTDHVAEHLRLQQAKLQQPQKAKQPATPPAPPPPAPAPGVDLGALQPALHAPPASQPAAPLGTSGAPVAEKAAACEGLLLLSSCAAVGQQQHATGAPLPEESAH